MPPPETPSSAPQEGNEHDAQIEAVRVQLQGLQEAIQSTLENKEELILVAATKLADALEPLSELPEEQRTQKITKIVEAVAGEFLTDPKAIHVLQGICESKEDLAALQASITTADIADELGALPTQAVEKAPEASSMVGSAFEWMDYLIAKVAEGKNLGEKQQVWVEKISDTMKEVFVGLLEKMGSVSLPLIGNISILGAADEQALADRRFVQQRKKLAATPAIEQKFTQQHKAKWMLAYKAWLTNQKGKDMPTLESVIQNVTVTPTPEIAAATPQVFEGATTERTIGTREIVPIAVGPEVRMLVQQKEIEVQLPAKNVCIHVQNKQGANVVLQRITRPSQATDAKAFTLEAANNPGKFTVEALLAAAENVANGNQNVLITNTELTVTKIT